MSKKGDVAATFDQTLALELIEKLAKALSEAEPGKTLMTQRLLQQAFDFIDQNGRSTPRFD